MACKKELLQKLIKGIETGDPEVATVVNEDKYIRHNPRTAEGSPGLAELFARLAKTNPRVLAESNFVLSMSEGNKCRLHPGLHELFRIAHGKMVEHWHTILPIAPRSEWKNENGKL